MTPFDARLKGVEALGMKAHRERMERGEVFKNSQLQRPVKSHGGTPFCCPDTTRNADKQGGRHV